MSISNKIFKRFSQDDETLRGVLRNMLGFKPKYLPYYILAITHRSKSEKIASNNERLEFLGDAYIGAIIGEYLFKKYPNKDEGYLTEMRSKIVSRVSLNEIARRMGLEKIVRYNQNDRLLRRSQIFGNALEALVGAIYLDVGFERTRKFILKRILATYIDMEMLETTEFNFKNKLYTWAHKHDHALEFVTVAESMEAGRKVFTIALKVNGETFVSASGYSKKQASQMTAQTALEKIENSAGSSDGEEA